MAMHDVVVMLHDFAFRSPEEILAELGGSSAHGGGHGGRGVQGGSHAGHGGTHSGHRGSHAGHGHMPGMAHANDVRYDAFLANDRTLYDPEVLRVEKGSAVRLRLINAGTATAFFVTTPGLASTCIAVDGSPCRAVAAAQYPLAQGQRIDLMVLIPQAGGAFPVLAQVEGDRQVTGVVLATAGADVRKLTSSAERAMPLVDGAFEGRLAAVEPLAAKPAQKRFDVTLGEAAFYRWTINGRIHGEHVPFDVGLGERVELTFLNPTSMMHPMHLHGHRFQVVALGWQRYAGPLRDTVIVPVGGMVTIAFDAVHRGAWFLHCHHLYHMATGMMTEVRVT
jgi:FtsP/CotA-like multicopper oxidase with cupredoxin domain